MLAVCNELQLTDKYALSIGLPLIEMGRAVCIERTILTKTETFPRKVRYVDRTVAPRVGLRYKASDNLQVFGNITCSVDPPVTWQIRSTGVTYVPPLQPQKATTAEIVLRTSNDTHEGSLLSP